MKRYLLYTILFTLLFAQIAESKENNEMFVFEYKILRASEINTLFKGTESNVVTDKTYNDMYYIFGSVKLSLKANFPTAMAELKLFDSKRKSLNCTYKLGWVGSANATFFLIKLWNSQTIPEIKYNFDILMRK
jgi:hypothetical protein